jgi:coproporphyrinogen III oxidase-like Fe-S oxidoreductase
MYQTTHDLLTNAGFNHYEISNYGKPGSESRHNTMYWEGDTEYMAFGCGAASYIDGYRFTRPKSLKQYYRYIDSNLKISED